MAAVRKCPKSQQEEIIGQTDCSAVSSCPRGEFCPWRHGTADHRRFCTTCKARRVAPGTTKCDGCRRSLRGKKPKDLQCQFLLSEKGCVRGQHCPHRHGEGDVRPICPQCRNVRVSAKGVNCKQCKLATKIGNLLVAIKVMQKTVCKRCKRETKATPVTGERYCVNPSCASTRSLHVCQGCFTVLTPYNRCKGCSHVIRETGKCTAYGCIRPPLTLVHPEVGSSKREVVEAFFCAQHGPEVLREHV